MKNDTIASRALAASFSDALIAKSPAADLGEHSADLAWLIGGWRALVRDFDDDGSVHESTGEWWFSWVLEGRAVQDVWIVPRRSDARPNKRDRYGTTIRWLDRKSGLWRISWFNPVTGAHNDLTGKRHGNGLIFEGLSDGTPIRWSFTDITPYHFTWRGEDLSAGKAKLGSEFLLSRIL